jgi:hypothetical protein
MKPGKDPGRPPREEAQRALNEVRVRYGIYRSQRQELPRVEASLSPPQATAEPKPRHPVSLKPPTSKISLPPVERTRFAEWPLDLGWVYYPSTPAPVMESAWDDYWFHYLIRIAECELSLHCEIRANNNAAARRHVERIPNLLEWRQISGEELAEILKLERA